MRKNVCKTLFIMNTVLLLVAAPSVGMSQSVWLPPSDASSVSVEVFKVDWTGEKNESFASSVSFMTGRYQTSKSITIVGEIPMSHFTSKLSNPGSIAIGSPYLGIRWDPDPVFHK